MWQAALLPSCAQSNKRTSEEFSDVAQTDRAVLMLDKFMPRQ